MSSGLVKGIAVASLQRLDDFNELPTVAETLPNFVAGGWNVLLAPVGTPYTILQKVSADLREAISDAGVRKKLAQFGAYVQAMTPDEVTQFTIDQQRIWKPVAEKVAKEMAQPPQ